MTKYPPLLAVVFGIAIAIAASPSAWATGVKPPAPQPTPSPAAEALAQQQQGQQQGQDQSQSIGDVTGGQGGAGGSVGNVTAGGASSLSSAAGGSSRATGTGGQSYAASGDVLNNIGGSKMFAFAAPAWTKVPSAVDCTHSDAMAWSATIASYSRTKQFTGAVCAMLDMADKADNSCQYGTAALLRREAMVRLVDDLTPEALQAVFPERPNLTPMACADLLRPRLIMDARPIQSPSVTSISVTAPQQECPKPQTRIVYRDKPAQKPCVNCCK
jgi:hypothetical protein